MDNKFPKGKKNDPVWWGIIAVMYCTGVLWWLALILTFLNISGSLPPIQELANWIKERSQGRPTPTIHAGQPQQQTQQRPQAAQQTPKQSVQTPKAAEKAAKRERKTPKFLWQTITGGVISALMGVSLFSEIARSISSSYFSWDDIGILGGLFTLGLVFLYIGKKNRDKGRRYEILDQMLGDDVDLPVQTIADLAGQSVRTTEEDLQDMITRGYFPEGTWLDRSAGRLRTKPYEEPEEVPVKKTSTSQAEKVLKQIRTDNDLIDDPEISAKIDRIESLTRKIFAFQEQHPERRSELRSFMNYYLPQTLKLLEAYARMEAQGADTDSARQTKEMISSALDLLATGYSRQLDKLLSSEAVDITADIKVMETMLARDGLTEDLHF